ncbi:MAG: hypothetical protein RL136_86 [Planctomycetota bacterium]|jgi:hypothetical protein
MAKSTTRSSRSGDMTVYTALLFVAFLVLAAGVTVVTLSNLSQAEADGQSGSPFALVR